MQRLSRIVYPNFDKDIVSFGFVKEAYTDANTIYIVLDIPSTAQEVEDQLRLEIERRLLSLGIYTIEIAIKKPKTPKESSSHGKNLLPNIQNFVMVSSGKGGVGKSTTTVNLAIALAQQGKRVGLLDADIYGPNIPRMMGIEGEHPVFLGKTIKPIVAHNLKVMSIGLLVERGSSLIWKGAMVKDIEWGRLDVLLFDMPPGTGDAQLALAQSLHVTTGVCVTTPQKVALDDAIRSLDMFRQLHIPIAGVVENMSGFICPESGKEYALFGKGTTQPLADAYDTEILGEIPIEPAIREGGDSGLPITVIAPNCESSKRYQAMATKLWDTFQEIQSEGGVDNEGIQATIF